MYQIQVLMVVKDNSILSAYREILPGDDITLRVGNDYLCLIPVHNHGIPGDVFSPAWKYI